jgi:S-adenosyl methyltransferase
MTVEPGWLPPEIDTGKANIARVYDYWLGGTSNFLADQDAARALLALEPNARGVARANRAFLGRAVRYLAGPAGIRQFLDIGSGIPTAGNVHEVAQQTAPGSHVVYADVDQAVVAHSKLLLKDQPGATVIHADLRQPEKILSDPTVQAMIDFRQPVALLLVAVLHFVADDEDPWQIVSTLREALPPGSHLVVCHACRDSRPELAAPTERAYEGRVRAHVAIRPHEQIQRFFDGFEILDPGLVYLPLWRPDSLTDIPQDPSKFWGLAGVGRRSAKS